MAAGHLSAQDNVFHGDVDLDDSEEYQVFVYAWSESPSDTVPGGFDLVHSAVYRGQYAFDLKVSSRLFFVVWMDVKGRKKYCAVVEPGTDKGRFENDVTFRQATTRLYFKSDVKNSTMNMRTIRTTRY